MTSEEIKESKAPRLAASTNQPPERSCVCEPVHKLDLEGCLVLTDLHGPVLGESWSSSSLLALVLSVCGVVALAASALVAVVLYYDA